MQKYLNMAIFKIIFLLILKSWSYGTPFYVVIYRSYKLLKLLQFFGPHCLYTQIRKHFLALWGQFEAKKCLPHYYAACLRVWESWLNWTAAAAASNSVCHARTHLSLVTHDQLTPPLGPPNQSRSSQASGQWFKGHVSIRSQWQPRLG